MGEGKRQRAGSIRNRRSLLQVESKRFLLILTAVLTAHHGRPRIGSVATLAYPMLVGW